MRAPRLSSIGGERVGPHPRGASIITAVGASFRTTKSQKPESGRVRIRPRSRREGALILIGGAMLGAGIPLAWFLFAIGAGWTGSERYVALIGGTAVSYLALSGGAALVVTRLRLRQTRRETNLPWRRSLTEWRDTPGEFNHTVEDVLVTGAAVSVFLGLGLLLVGLVSAVTSGQ